MKPEEGPDMTDRELLELAAKAAGVVGYWKDHGGALWLMDRQDHGDPWNPLLDDGDALRLAVKVLNWPHGGRAFDNAVIAMSAVGELPKDPYAATRRAIAQAAAWIGQGLR